MEGFLVRGLALILLGWCWLMLALAGITPFRTNLLEKASSLWHGFGQWEELESANRMPVFVFEM